METSEKVSIFARLNVKGGIPSPLHNPPMRVDTLSGDFVYSLGILRVFPMFSMPYGRKRPRKTYRLPSLHALKAPGLLFRAHPASSPTGGLQSLRFTIPYAAAYCPPMTVMGLWGYYTVVSRKKQGERGGKNEGKSRRRAKEALPLPAFSFILYTVVQYAFALIK